MGPHHASKNLLVWSDDIEAEALEQAARASRLPFVKGHVALMPDAHSGKGACVGSVIPTIGAIIPAAVGVDIGCGMVAVQTRQSAADLPDSLEPLMSLTEQRIPAGMGEGHEQGTDAALAWFAKHDRTDFDTRQEETTLQQFGTLGSGNHFVEVCTDEHDGVWLVLHSGSRGIGNRLAQHHIKIAQRLAETFFIPLEDPDLAYLPQTTPEFKAYIDDLMWAQSYAAANREQMMDELVRSLAEVLGLTPDDVEADRINCHHNYTAMEHHHGRKMWITRKGAIKAGLDDRGVIPGSMGTRSYIVRGLGNPASYDSCSHGAGRRMSRSRARKSLTVASLNAAMGDRVWNAARADDLIDEHPDAYKDIDAVMADQADLVAVEHTLLADLQLQGLRQQPRRDLNSPSLEVHARGEIGFGLRHRDRVGFDAEELSDRIGVDDAAVDGDIRRDVVRASHDVDARRGRPAIGDEMQPGVVDGGLAGEALQGCAPAARGTPEHSRDRRGGFYDALGDRSTHTALPRHPCDDMEILDPRPGPI